MNATRHASWWERGRIDDPPAPAAAELPRHVDVLVVGAGFMGRWLAYFLTRRARGAAHPRVLVVERDGFSYGASSRNAGFLTCGHISEMLADAAEVGEEAVVESFMSRRRGMAVVEREFPALGRSPCGSVDHDPVTAEGRRLAATLNEAAGEAVFSFREARAVGCEGRCTELRTVAFNSLDRGLHPVDLLRRLRDGARADFAFGTTARDVAGGTARLETTSGEREVRYGHAFLCTNGFTAALHGATSVRPGRGQVIVTSPVGGVASGGATPTASEPLGYLNRGYDYFRWVGPRLLVGGGRHRFSAEENGVVDLAPTSVVRSYLTDLARRIVGHDDLTVEAHWAGIMGFPGGAHIGASPRHAIDDVTEALAGFGGMGVALTPSVAEEVARAFD